MHLHRPHANHLSASQNSFFQRGLEGAIECGRAARHAWIRDGVVLCSADFAALRGVTADELPALEGRGDLFAVDVDGETCWPAELLRFRPEEATSVCQALAGCDDAVKLVFLMRRHGALAGHTILEAVAQGRLAAVLRLAKSWRDS